MDLETAYDRMAQINNTQSYTHTHSYLHQPQVVHETVLFHHELTGQRVCMMCECVRYEKLYREE